ncbi:MAG TPA: C1 family peptidase [Bacillota bacterium]|nr:C1 family peptidase [Bacillota bacterium]
MKQYYQISPKKIFWKGIFTVGLLLLTVTSGTIFSLTQPVWAASNIGPGLTEEEISEMRTEVHRRRHSFAVGHNVATKYKLSQLCGLQLSFGSQQMVSSTQTKVKLLTALPSKFDWRDVDGLTPVRNQGNCGSCWAFSTLGALEANIKIKDNQSVDLSEQYLISCNKNNWGCNGGWWAFSMLTSGAALESSFPYRAADVACQTVSTPYKIEKWSYVGASSSVPSVEAIKNAIYQYGPVTVAVYVDRYFQAYQSGIFDRHASGQPNHGVVLTGWDDSQGCWIMRNSWGSNWGESGYMRIKYGTSSIGYAAAYVVYKGGVTPTAVPTSTPTPTTTVKPTPSLAPSPSSSPSPTPTITPGTDNLALNQTVQASGSLSGYEAAKAVDGNLSTRWAASAAYSQWLAVNLKRSCTSGTVKIKWSQTNYARRYILQGWNGSQWINLQTVTGDGDWDSVSFSSSSAIGRIRVSCSSRASSYYLIYELEVYQTAAKAKRTQNTFRGRR